MSLDSKPARSAVFLSLMVSYGYVGFQFLMTPVRIKILTTIMDKDQYFLLNIVVMTIAFLTMALSLGSFEFLYRKLPGEALERQLAHIRFYVLVFGGLALAGAMIAMPLLYLLQQGVGFKDIHFSPGDILAAGLGLVLWSHLLQRHCILLALSKMVAYRVTQFLYAELWFVAIVVMYFVQGRSLNQHQILWTWTGWMAFCVIATAPALPYIKAMKAPRGLISFREISVFCIPLVPMVFGEQLFRLGDRYIIWFFHGVSPGADYTLCMNISLIAYLVGNNLLMLSVPAFNRIKNRLQEEGRRDFHQNPELQQLFTLMLRYSWIFALLTAAAFLIIPRAIVLLLAHSKFIGVADLLPYAAPVSFFFLTFTVNSRVLIALDRPRTVGWITLGGAGLNIVLNLILVPRWAGEGAATATWISLALMTLISGRLVGFSHWLVPGGLKGDRLFVLFFIAAGGFWVLNSHAGFSPLLTIALCGIWTGIALFITKLVHPHDFVVLFKKAD